MGVSSAGILVFGFKVGGEDEPPAWLEWGDGEAGDEDNNHFCEFLARRAGQQDDDFHAKYEREQNCPAELTKYSSCDYPMFFLAVRGVEYSVSLGECAPITPDMLAVDPEKIAAFKVWCEEIGIEYQRPQWHLCSMYG